MASNTIQLTLITVGFILGLTLFIGGAVFGWSILPRAAKQQINHNLGLENGTDLFNKWINITEEVKIKFFMFNITNPQALENPGQKLRLQQLGPYVYNEKREKINITWSADTIAYREKITYYFNAEESNGSQNDPINTLNFPFITAGHVGYATNNQLASLFIDMSSSDTEMPDGIIEEVTVGQVLFQGWQLNKAYKMIPSEWTPPELVDLKFGYYRTINGTAGKEFVIKSGKAKDHKDICHVISYDNMTRLHWWNRTVTFGKRTIPKANQYCNQINGTDRSLFPPFMTKRTVLDLFSPMACRSIRSVFHSEVTYKGIPAYRFKIDDGYLADPSKNKYEACFCQSQSPRLAHYCLKGFYRIWPCTQGSPLVLSNPHFFNGDSSLLNPIDIDPPNPHLHETYIIIEPTTGAVLSARGRSQVNIELQRLPNFTLFEDLDFTEVSEGRGSIIVPIFWVEEQVEMTDEDIEKIQKLAIVFSDIQVVKWSSILIGLLIMAISTVSLGRTMS